MSEDNPIPMSPSTESVATNGTTSSFKKFEINHFTKLAVSISTLGIATGILFAHPFVGSAYVAVGLISTVVGAYIPQQKLSSQ